MGNFLRKQLELTGAGGMWRMAWFVVSCVHLMPADFLGHSRGLSSIQHISHPALGQFFSPLCGFASDVRLSDIINLGSQRLSSICYESPDDCQTLFFILLEIVFHLHPQTYAAARAWARLELCSPAPHAEGCLRQCQIGAESKIQAFVPSSHRAVQSEGALP